jgi:hypothetical protein
LASKVWEAGMAIGRRLHAKLPPLVGRTPAAAASRKVPDVRAPPTICTHTCGGRAGSGAPIREESASRVCILRSAETESPPFRLHHGWHELAIPLFLEYQACSAPDYLYGFRVGPACDGRPPEGLFGACASTALPILAPERAYDDDRSSQPESARASCVAKWRMWIRTRTRPPRAG